MGIEIITDKNVFVIRILLYYMAKCSRCIFFVTGFTQITLGYMPVYYVEKPDKSRSAVAYIVGVNLLNMIWGSQLSACVLKSLNSSHFIE